MSGIWVPNGKGGNDLRTLDGAGRIWVPNGKGES